MERKTRTAISVIASMALPLGSWAENVCEFNYSLQTGGLLTARHHMGLIHQIILTQEISQTLVTQNDKEAVRPGLASSWTIDEAQNSVTFNLEPSCGWSDGVPITAKDVVAGFRELYSYDPPSFAGWSVIKGARDIVENAAPIETLGVEEIDDYKVKITFSTDTSLGLAVLSYPSFTPIPTHVPDNELRKKYSPERVYSGRKFVVSNNANEIILNKNKNFCANIPNYVDKTTVYLLDDYGDRINYFLNGKIDLITDINEQQARTILKNNSDKHFLVSTLVKNSQANLFMHPSTKALADPEIRAALRDALDFKRLGENPGGLTKDYIKVKSVFHRTPEYKNIPYPVKFEDPKEGLANLKKLMEEKGYSAENPATVTIMALPKKYHTRLVNLIASMLKPAHFNMVVLESTYNTDVLEQFSTKAVDIALLSWNLDYQHAFNSYEGFRFFYSKLKQQNGSWIDYGENDEYLKGFEERANILNGDHSGIDLNAALQDMEAYLTEWNFVIPLQSKVYVALSSPKIIPSPSALTNFQDVQCR